MACRVFTQRTGHPNCNADRYDLNMPSASSLPDTLREEDRGNSVVTLPGGYNGYLKALKRIVTIVEHGHLSRTDLVSRLQSELSITALSSKDKVWFLRHVGLLHDKGGELQVGDCTRRWIDSEDASHVIALLHSRCRFIGEMLAELQKTPRSTSEILAIAEKHYSLQWSASTQIDARRGWLQSAGFIKVTWDRKLAITEAGTAFLSQLARGEPSKPGQPADPEHPTGQSPVHALVTEIADASTDSQNPDRFERAVHDAFANLGFQSELLGGSGRTDVLLTARLGRHDSYKVTVDAKTTASGHLPDMQVDWATLVEHRANQEADYSLLVGPNPRGDRLFNRAADHEVTVLSAQQLAELCRRHANAPLGLHDYRLLFTAHGRADLTELEQRTETSRSLLLLASDIYRKLAASWDTFGYLTARDLRMLLPLATTNTIQGVLDTLASPLVGAIHGDPEKGYVLASNPKVAQLRLTLLGEELTRPEPDR